MATSDYFDAISVRQLSPNALDAVIDSLRPRGFEPHTMIEQDYAFSDRDGRQIKTNLLAFAHETFRSPDYRGLTVFNPANGIDEVLLAQSLAQSAAPFHLIHHHQTQRFSLWFTNASNKTSRGIEAKQYETDIDYSRLAQVIERYGSDINPQRIIDVKQGRDFFKHFEHEGPFQLALWAIEVTGDRLVQHFGRAVETLRENNVPDETIPDVATQLLGATILAHTGAFGSDLRQRDPSLDDLISNAHRKFRNYFNPYLFERWQHAIVPAYHILTALRYSNFAPELLTRLYKEAFPDVAQRRKLGRYDTPLYLTRRIWETIPVEFLPPEKRIVADMTCGWGSFLISGYERLSRMIDMKDHPIRDHIYGNDNELFTTRLAGLGLLISTLQDRWHISNQDALEWSGPSTQPNIIVGNPPFHGLRKAPSEEHTESLGRYEKANQFLNHAIDILAPNGYLAMLMPQSFVALEASPLLREKLLETCDVLELWELPIGVFEAQANSLVIFARKKWGDSQFISHFPVQIRTVQHKQRKRFEENGPFTASSLVSDQSKWNIESRRSKNSENTHIMRYWLILSDQVWSQIQEICIHLDRCAEVFQGTIQGKNDQRKRWVDYEKGKDVTWIKNARNLIQDSFNPVYGQTYKLTYPNDFEEPRKSKDPKKSKEVFLDSKKIVLNANANPTWGKRIKVVIERKGYHVSNRFVIVVPKSTPEIPGLSHEALAAILDWKVSNGWVLEHLKHAKIPIPALRRLPIPKLKTSECKVLEKAVLDIEAAFASGYDRPKDATQRIDDILRKAYQLDDETYERLSLIAEWDTRSPSTLDLQFDPKAQWEISGVVDDVDAENGQITLWLNGFDELQTVPIVPIMPGWLLRPEVAFRTSIPRACVDQRYLAGNASWGFFYPQDYTYLNEEELFDQLVETLS